MLLHVIPWRDIFFKERQKFYQKMKIKRHVAASFLSGNPQKKHTAGCSHFAQQLQQKNKKTNHYASMLSFG